MVKTVLRWAAAWSARYPADPVSSSTARRVMVSPSFAVPWDGRLF